MNGQEYYRAYPLLVAGAFVSALLSSFAAQAMPGMTATETAVVSAVPVVSAPAEYEPTYRQHCAVCHGDKGDGNSRAQHGLKPAPRNFTTAEAWQALDRERMINSVTYGRPNTAMVGWKGRLDEAQIAGVVDYVRSSFMRAPDLVTAGLASAVAVPALNASKRAGNSGRDIYKRNCSACHGDKGNGATWTQNGLNPPPRDFTTDAARSYLTRERMVTSVTYGRQGTAMMPFSSRLSAGEIGLVVDYIRGDFMHVPDTPVSIDVLSDSASPHAAAQHQASASQGVPAPSFVESDMRLQLPHDLAGDAAAGREFYMANCFVCHGVRGDGHGPRSSFITPRPRNFLGERARKTLNRPALFHAIATGLPGTVMPAWSKVLNNQEIADVTEFVFLTFIQREKTAPPIASIATEVSAMPGKSLQKIASPSVEKSVDTSTTQAQTSPLTGE